MMSSKDSLRQRYIDIQVLYSVFEVICFLVAILINGNESILIISLVPLLDICRLVIHQILFDKFIEMISLFFQIYLFLFMISSYIVVTVVDEKSHLLSYFLLLYFPFSYKLSIVIQRILNNYNLKNFEKNLIENDKIKVETLDYIVRSVIFKINRSENEQNHFEIRNIAYIIKNSEILVQIYHKQVEQLIQEQKLKKESINLNIESLLDENDENLLGGYEIDTTSQKGREYIGKEQVFGENKQFKKVIQNMFNSLFLKERNPKQFGMIDIYYLVFIVEVLQNYQFFELTNVQIQKNISLKHQQILFTIMKEVETSKETMRILSDEQQIFDSSFYEALIYDELILQTEFTLEEAVQKKISLLLFMKQRHINLEDLQIQLEELLKLREDLISQITLLIKVNEYSHRLYDAYLNYLETLSFSENDIKLDRFNRYQKGQRKIYFQMNSSDACVLFASLKSEKDMKITKVSNNIQFILGFEKSHLINNSIELIMPQPYTAIHKEYVLNFFSRGDTSSNLKQLLIFANTNSNHIIPINIDIKVNMISGEKDFGITAYIQRSQKQAQYILFDSQTSRLVSMTSELNQFVFPFIKNFNRISLTPYFPFIQHFRHIYGNSSSNILSRTSQLTLNSVRTRQFGTNQSFRSHEGTARKGSENQKENKKPKSIKDQQILQKQINEVKDQQDHMLPRFKKGDETSKNEQLNKKKQMNNSERDKRGIEDMFSDSDDRRYRDLHFLLVISNQKSILMSMKSKQVQGINDYKFYIMSINLFTSDSPGLETLKYMEITQVKQINPILNSKFILQIYNDEIEGYMTNLHNFRTSDTNYILTELEMKGIKDSNRVQNLQDQQIFQDNEQIQEFDLLQSKNDNNQEVIFNRYASQVNNYRPESKDIINSLMGNKKYDTDEMEKSQRSGSLYKQKKSGNVGASDNNFYNQKSMGFDSNLYQFQQAAQYVKGKQKSDSKEIKKISTEIVDDSKNIYNDKYKVADQSAVQLLKQNSNDISTSFIGTNLKQHQFNQDNNISNYNDQSKQVEHTFDNSNYQQPQELFEEKVFSPHPISLVSPVNQSSHDIRAGLVFANLSKINESTAAIQESAKYYGLNNDQSTNFPKLDIFSPKDISSNQALKSKNQGFLSPVKQQNSIQKMQSSLFSPDRNDLNPQSPINEIHDSQQMNDLIVKQVKNTQINRQISQSVKSLSKKRKKVIAAHKNEIKNLKDALDSTSNHSRESSASSTRKSTKSIILQKTTLGVMRVVNGIGIASFLVIIIVILQQYLQMNTSFNNFQGDMNFVNWASSYQISLSLVMKNYNFNKLLDTQTISIANDTKKILQTKAKEDLINAVVDIQLLLQRISTASTERQIVQKMLNTNYNYKLGSLVSRETPLDSQPSNYFFNTVNYDVSLYVGSHMLFAYLYRYSRGLGTGTAQFIAVSNSEAIVGSLLDVSKQCQSYSIEQLTKIEVDVDSVLIIICLVTAFCIFTIIPVYSFIQTKREQIIQLFGTFNSTFIDSSIFEIQRIYSKNNSIKSITIQQMGSENQKRQNLSSTSRLNRTNNTVLVMAVVIFILTLPYPILNKTLSNRYISQNKDGLPMLQSLYDLQSYILEDTSLSLFAINLKVTPGGAFKYESYKTILASNMKRATNMQLELQDRIEYSRNAVSYDTSLYENYFLKIFEENACEIVFKYPIYISSNSTITETECKNLHKGIFSKGLTIAVKSFFTVLGDLVIILEETNSANFKEKIGKFQENNDFKDFVRFQDYLVEIIEALSIYEKTESVNHKNFLQSVLLGLLLYQFLIMGLIFYFGWIIFYKNMDHYLYKTKLYLAVLNINYLIQNPYIQNYLHKNLS